MIKGFYTETFYSPLQWTVESAVMDCTVCYSGLYGLHRKTIEDNRNKDLSCMEKKGLCLLLKEVRFRYGKISDRYTGKLFTGSPPPLDFSLYLCRKNKAVHETTQRT